MKMGSVIGTLGVTHRSAASNSCPRHLSPTTTTRCDPSTSYFRPSGALLPIPTQFPCSLAIAMPDNSAPRSSRRLAETPRAPTKVLAGFASRRTQEEKKIADNAAAARKQALVDNALSQAEAIKRTISRLEDESQREEAKRRKVSNHILRNLRSLNAHTSVRGSCKGIRRI